MRRQGVEHPDAVKGLADQPAIRLDPDRVDDPAGLGIREQHITEAGSHGLVRHGHGKPREIAQVPHAREGRRKVFRGHLQRYPDGIDTTLVQQSVREDGNRHRPVVGLIGEVAIEACRGADRRATLRHGDLLWRNCCR
jgi:hypothetical protein